MLLLERLGPNALHVGRERDGRRTEIAAVFGVPAGALTTQVGQLIEVVVHGCRTAIHDQLVAFELAQQFVHQHEGEPDVVGDVAPDQIAAGQQQLEDERFHFAFGQPDFAERLRFVRQEHVGVPVEHGFRAHCMRRPPAVGRRRCLGVALNG